MTLENYWMGRNILYVTDLTPEIMGNAAELLERVRKLLGAFGEVRAITSGWRPPSVNATTVGAATRSRHMSGQAVDLADPEGDLDEWCFENQEVLQHYGLWLEHPATTKNWTHLQSVPPKSGKRVFYP